MSKRIERLLKSDLTFCKNTQYIGIKDKNRAVIAVGGVLIYSNYIKVKNLYVVPGFRGQGYFKCIVDFILETFKNKTIKAGCTKYSINYFLEKGFQIKKEYKNGIIDVERRFLK